MNKQKVSLFYKKQSLILIICLSIVSFFLGRLFFSHRVTWIDKTASIVLYPIIQSYNHIIAPMYNFYKYYDNYLLITQERDTYKELYYKTLSTLVSYKAINHFDKITTPLEKFKQRYKTEHTILCKVILQQLSSDQQMLTVNVGSIHGIKKDMLAVQGAFLFGRVYEVFPLYSTILLITDKRSRVSVYCEQTNTHGIVEGTNNKDDLIVSYINSLETLEVNDLLITSGQGMIYPEGFSIGTLESYTTDKLHYTAHATPLYNIEKINYCYLIPYEKCSYAAIIEYKKN